MALRDQLKICLTSFEEHFDLPAFSVNPDDLFFGKIRIRADEGYPILLVFLIAYTDDLCQSLLFFSNQDIY